MMGGVIGIVRRRIRRLLNSEDPIPPVPVHRRCFRKIDWNSGNNLKERISNYKPRKSKVSHVNIVLFGLVGSGKSSFFNTIDSIFKGRVAMKADAGSSVGSMTKKFRIYTVYKSGLTGTSKDELCAFRLCDTMGMEEDQGLELTDVPNILDGRLLDHYQFLRGQSATLKSEKFAACPNSSMAMHVVCYLVDCTKVKVASKILVAKFKKLRELAEARDIRTVIILTKIDQFCPLVQQDIKMAYQSDAIQQVIKELSVKFGIPQSLICVIQNYENEHDLNPDMDVLALTALEKLLNFADDCLDNL